MERSIVRVHLKDRKIVKDMMPMLNLTSTINQFTMANKVWWYVLKREDGHILKIALAFEIQVQGNKEVK